MRDFGEPQDFALRPFSRDRQSSIVYSHSHYIPPGGRHQAYLTLPFVGARTRARYHIRFYGTRYQNFHPKRNGVHPGSQRCAQSRIRLARSREGVRAHEACSGPRYLGLNCVHLQSVNVTIREKTSLYLTDVTVSPIPLKSLDRLYETALRTAGNWSDNRFCSDCLAILGLILVVKIPLSCGAMDDILSLPRPTLHTIKGLRSVLRWSESDPIRILHPSFQDFVSDRFRSGISRWFVDLDMHNDRIAVHCITLLEGKLKKNICNLAVREPFADCSLSESLSYACIYWIEHILAAKAELHLQRIYTFLSKHLLHWMETMSILGMSRRTMKELKRLHRCFEQVHF